jgi:hypothetical protein
MNNWQGNSPERQRIIIENIALQMSWNILNLPTKTRE